VAGKPCYPLRGPSGRPLGVVHRNIHEDGPKYKYPYGVRTSELLFGLYEATQTLRLFLVEGAMDVVAVREAGHDALGTYGARLYEHQLEEIVALHPREVLIAYDMDKAGRIGSEEAIDLLTDAGILARRVTWDDRYKDLGEMDLATRSTTLTKVLASTPT
jgi:DNA primase